MTSTRALLARARRAATMSDMDILKMLNDLRSERDRFTEAITVMERLAVGERRRGRPPKWMAATHDNGKRRGRPPGSKNRAKVAG